jgi:dienelactone hydrolase
MLARRCLPLFVALGAAAAAFAGDPRKSPTVDERIRDEARGAPLALRFRGTTAGECRAWQKEFAAKLRAALGPYDPPKEWKATAVRKVEHDDHTFEDLILEAKGHPALPLCVLTPKGGAKGKRAGVLALHGHGPRGHLAIGEGDAGRTLVRRGYVVVAPCFTPFGVRLGKEDYGKQDACGVTFVRLQLLGKLLIAENLRDSLWALEFLAARPEVDANRLGCVGLSYGGRMTMLTAALEPRIKVAVVAGALNVMQERIQVKYGCGAQVIPGLLKYGDVPEIGSLIAPRPAVWQWGTEDALIKRDWAEEAAKRMRSAYEALGAADNFVIDRFEGGHAWHWEGALPELQQALRK